MKRFMSSDISEPLLPTAASAWLLANRPTTAVSTELNNCYNLAMWAFLFHSTFILLFPALNSYYKDISDDEELITGTCACL